jgi:hypothetical protein
VEKGRQLISDELTGNRGRERLTLACSISVDRCSGGTGSGRAAIASSDESDFYGFRLASPVAVPEPSTWVMGLAGLACGGWQMFRRRKQA